MREQAWRIAVVTGLILATPGLSQGQASGSNPLDAKAKQVIDRSNAKLPAMVAPTLRQERIAVYNGVVTYAYTVTTKTGAELAPMNLGATQRPYIFPALCQASDTGRMLREGYRFRYLYYGRDGKIAAQLIFLPSDCGF